MSVAGLVVLFVLAPIVLSVVVTTVFTIVTGIRNLFRK